MYNMGVCIPGLRDDHKRHARFIANMVDGTDIAWGCEGVRGSIACDISTIEGYNINAITFIEISIEVMK